VESFGGVINDDNRGLFLKIANLAQQYQLQRLLVRIEQIQKFQNEKIQRGILAANKRDDERLIKDMIAANQLTEFI
jgi:hypothetical protein